MCKRRQSPFLVICTRRISNVSVMTLNWNKLLAAGVTLLITLKNEMKVTAQKNAETWSHACLDKMWKQSKLNKLKFPL